MVHSAWYRGAPDLVRYLQEAKEDSHAFNMQVFGDIFRRKHLLEARIDGIQRRLESIDLGNLILLEKDLQVEYNQVLHQEEMLWFQKSREQWVRFGDRNTFLSMLRP